MRVFTSFQYEEVLGFNFGYHPYSKPNLCTHIYYIDGLLIDTGQRHCQQLIIDTTKQLDIDKILITHHHEDHTGNIDVLSKKHSCKVYASKLCCELMKQPPSISWAQKMVWGNRPANNKLIPIENQIETNKYTFQIIDIPGHAEDMIALYEPHKKWLFSADLYINSYIGYMLKNENIWQQIQSIKKILELDFEVLFCSHNPQLIHGKLALEKKLNFLEDFSDKVIQLFQNGNNIESIYKEMKLKENYFVKYLSFGSLSQKNMVKSVIKNYK